MAWPLGSVTVQIAFETAPDDPSPTWVDVTDDVDAQAGVSFNRGRNDEISDIEPGKCSFTLFNDEGDYTVGNETGAHYPYVIPYRRVRVTITDTDTDDRSVWDGTVDSWVTSVAEENNGQAVTTVTATERLARLGFLRKLRGLHQEEILADSPWVYHPMSESGGSYVGSIADAPVWTLTPSSVGTGDSSNISFGAAGPTCSSAGACDFSRIDASNGAYLKEAVNASGWVQVRGIECFFYVKNDPTDATDGFVSQQRIAALTSRYLSGNMRMYITTAGKLCAKYDTSLSTGYTITGTTTLQTSTWYHAALFETVSGTTVTATLYLNGVSEGTGTYTSGVSGFVSGFDGVAVGGHSSGELFVGYISDVAVYLGTSSALPSAARLQSHADAGLTGFSGELVSTMLEKYLGYLNVDSGDLSIGTSSSAMGWRDTADSAVSDVINDAMRVEWGTFFTDGAGVFTFQPRSHRYGMVAQAEFDCSAEEILPSLIAQGDASFLLNDLIVYRTDGVYFRALNADSVSLYGSFADARQSYAASNSDMMDAAYYQVAKYGEVAARSPMVEIDLLTNPTLSPDVLSLEIGDRISLTNLPTPFPAATIDLFVEGITMRVAYDEFTVSFQTSPVTADTAWIMDDATFSVMGSTTKVTF